MVKVQTNVQAIDSTLFIQSSQKQKKIICYYAVHFMYNHYVLLITFSQNMLKTKQLGKINCHHIQPAI